ncbi:hypothetical protein KUCAC02_025532, partial [Chaenocephalus aceratus]
MYRRVPDRKTSATTNDTRISGHEAEDTSTATESDSENQPARAAAATGSDTRAVSLNSLFGEDYFTQDPDHNEIVTDSDCTETTESYTKTTGQVLSPLSRA